MLVKPALKFIHLRYFEDVEYDDGTTHEDMIQNSGITVAYRQGSTHEGLDVAFSRCNPEYNITYSRKVGRSICEGRMNHDQYYKVPKPADGTSDFDSVVAYVNHKVMNDDADQVE